MILTKWVDWLINLPDNLGFEISSTEIRIKHTKFDKNKYLFEDLNTMITKIDISLVLEPNPILD